MHRFLLLFSFLFFEITGIAQEKDTSVILYYPVNNYTIDSNQKKQLVDFISSGIVIKNITGYADTTGTISYNRMLSEKRAITVALFCGLSKSQLQKTVSFKGEEHDQNPELYKNRRVEITATVKEKHFTRPSALSVIESLNIDNIYFLPDQAIIADESLPYVNELAQLLKNNYKTEHFEIIGHVNYQSNKDSTHLQDLYWLSERRAKAIYLYLIKNGIPAERMTFKGVGNSQPLIKNPINDEEKRKNMRVQVQILR
jgi:outer membrane protein OmpA-like peptidoglycan-associated protein